MSELDGQGVPVDFKLIYGPSWRFGRLQLLSRDSPATFWVQAHGVIVPRLIRVDVEYASAFGRGHPGGWDYVADIRQVRFVHPWNLFELRKVWQIPHLRNWIVVSSSGLLRAMFRALPGSLRPSLVVSTPEEALRRLPGEEVERKIPTTKPENTA